MTIVLVHGNPETVEVWDLLVPHLEPREVVRLSPPGFGAQVPSGFGATMREYRDWLIAELEAQVAGSGPVDLVGHDWGGGHVVNAAMARPDLLRSWASDVVGVFAPDYEWHQLAQAWQSPGAGEESIRRMLARSVAERAADLASFGMNPAVAALVAAGADEAMGDCILRLYRDAAQPAVAEAGADLEKAAARPGLALIASEDHMVGTPEQHRQAATRARARVQQLNGVGHWWMTQDPAQGAEALIHFWESV